MATLRRSAVSLNAFRQVRLPACERKCWVVVKAWGCVTCALGIRRHSRQIHGLGCRDRAEKVRQRGRGVIACRWRCVGRGRRCRVSRRELFESAFTCKHHRSRFGDCGPAIKHASGHLAGRCPSAAPLHVRFSRVTRRKSVRHRNINISINSAELTRVLDNVRTTPPRQPLHHHSLDKLLRLRLPPAHLLATLAPQRQHPWPSPSIHVFPRRQDICSITITAIAHTPRV